MMYVTENFTGTSRALLHVMKSSSNQMFNSMFVESKEVLLKNNEIGP